MAALERTYTIPLRRAFSKAPNYRRTERAVNELRRFIQHHMKCENVKIGRYLNLEMWKHGRKNPPPRIQVKVLKDKRKIKDKDVEFVLAELPEKPFEMPMDEKEKGKKEEKKEKKKATLEQHMHTETGEHAVEAEKIAQEEIKLEQKEKPKKVPQVEPAISKPKADGKLRQEEHFPRSQKPVHEKGK